ncbi:MAG: glycosyltransferase [Phycisphaerae bacterium]|nr:glycosyltransferase [Phycisphaerae bacterium]
MEALAIILTVAVSAISLEWMMRNALALKVWGKVFHLTGDAEGIAEGITPAAPLVSIVVAAKDEQHNIEQCLASLQQQDYPNFELIVVNDRSADATGEIIARIAANDPRVRNMDIEKLPAGWCGKNHAMQNGIAASNGKWILMTDADCRMSTPRTLSVAMRYATDNKIDMLSILPTMIMGSFWEFLLLPILSGILMVWFRPERVNNPQKPRAYANGMFMLIARDAYDGIGTHEAIKGSLIEDMELARRIKSSSRRLMMVPSRNMLSVRMYHNLPEILRGWNRIFVGSFRNLCGLVMALLVLLVRGMTTSVLGALGFILYAAGSEPSAWWLACGIIGAVGTVAELIMTARFYNCSSSKWQLGLLYLVGCPIAAGVLIRAMFALLPWAKITWRDTSYTASQGEDG